MGERCRSCGKPLPAQSGRGRRRVMCPQCSPKRDRSAPKRPKSKTPVVVDGLTTATRAELEDAGKVGSSAGQAALLLAKQVEFGDESGSGLAALVRQHRESMAVALVDVSTETADVLDELRARRDARGA